MLHDEVESFGAWGEVVLEDRETSRPGKLHTDLMFLWSEPCALRKQTQLCVCVGVCGVGGYCIIYARGGMCTKACMVLYYPSVRMRKRGIR